MVDLLKFLIRHYFMRIDVPALAHVYLFFLILPQVTVEISFGLSVVAISIRLSLYHLSQICFYGVYLRSFPYFYLFKSVFYFYFFIYHSLSFYGTIASHNSLYIKAVVWVSQTCLPDKMKNITFQLLYLWTSFCSWIFISVTFLSIVSDLAFVFLLTKFLLPCSELCHFINV